jgi:hypothetical protein
MGIIVDHGVRQDLPCLRMSNGLTSVFLGVLTIAMSLLAKTEREKYIAVWFSSHDQAIFGRGMVDFDVCDAPWRLNSFETDKEFILNAIQAASGKFEWERLGYSPSESLVLESLATFQVLVEHFREEDILPISEWSWQFGIEPEEFKQCAKHGVYLHSHGCVLCNDA